MRFIVYGAGAVGGVVAARLHQHGHEVALIARGPHLDAIRRNGLRLQSADEDVALPIPAFATPTDIEFREDDVILLGVKSQDTVDAARALAASTELPLPVVSLQNGVANEPALLRWFAHVYGVCVMAPTAHVEAGVVQANSVPISGLLDIGRYPHGIDATATAVADGFRAAQLESIVRPDIMRWKYTKLLMNLGNAVDATCAPGDAAGVLVRHARREGLAVLAAAGIAHTTQEEDRERRDGLLTIRPIGGALRGGGSTWQSLARGTGAIEVDYLNGEIVRLGRAHDVATPVNERLCRFANDRAHRRTAPGTADAAVLVRELGLDPN